LNPDFHDMLSAFADEGVEYLLVGADALAVYGLPRATAALDLWAHPSQKNAERVLRALGRFGAPLSTLSSRDFKHPDGVIQIGVAPKRKGITIEGITVLVIARDQLIQHKKAAGRPQDRADVSWLEAHD